MNLHVTGAGDEAAFEAGAIPFRSLLRIGGQWWV